MLMNPCGMLEFASLKLHVNAADKISLDPRHVASIFLWRPTGGTQSASKKIKTSSKLLDHYTLDYNVHTA